MPTTRPSRATPPGGLPTGAIEWLTAAGTAHRVPGERLGGRLHERLGGRLGRLRPGDGARHADGRAPSPAPRRIPLGDVLASMSRALDLTEGQPAGHTLRSCLVAGRLAQELALPAADRSALHYAVLLKDAGCSSNAARFAALFGTDDRVAKPLMKEVDWHQRVRLALRTAATVARGRPLGDKVRHFLGIARTPDVTRTLIAVRCERGAGIARSVGFPEATAEAIRSLDEHWDGGGYPEGLRGDAIPRLAQLSLLAQTVEAFHAAGGVRGALRAVRARRGTWFDPALVDRVLAWKRDRAWWATLAATRVDVHVDDHAAPSTPTAADNEAIAAVTALEPGEHVLLVDEAGLDRVAHAFAEVVDAKSPYTFRHSANVARYAAAIGGALGYDPEGQRRLHRAGLLHDVGKLGVSNTILDSPNKLGPEERIAVERHPRFTWDILSRVRAFSDFAWAAATHHEKLDGSGYPWKLDGSALDGPARVLVVADIYEALTADRPYRAGMSHEAAMAILGRERTVKLDPDAVDALDALGRAGAFARES